MTLAALIKQAGQINDEVETAKGSLLLDELMSRRDVLNSMASRKAPQAQAEVCYLCDLIAEYAEFVADGPTSPEERHEALTAIDRIARNLKSAPSFS